MNMPPLETDRLIIRPFVIGDLEAAYRILDVELADANTGTDGAQTIEERRAWLQWSVLNYQQLAYMHQPPFGDRAIELRATGELIGACGYVPAMGPFEMLPSSQPSASEASGLFTSEFGLYWAVAPAFQRQGYASEAARTLIGYAFEHLNLKRIVATTSYDNLASQAVMRKVGMRLEHNPHAEPFWFQVVGVVDNSLSTA
jgi:[ribosomal protein S5]-alanine N-acetyltransferase